MKLTKEQVNAFRKNPTVNPLTQRKIKEGKQVYRQLQKACLDHENELIRMMNNLQLGTNEIVADNFTNHTINIQQLRNDEDVSDAESTV
jgi:hypothetical protein